MKHAQVSMEFVLVMGMIFLMVLPLVVVYMKQSISLEQDIISTQGYKVATKMRDAADEIFLAGYPSKKTFNVYFPDKIQNITFFENYINLTFHSGQLEDNIIVSCLGNITGNMTSYQGVHTIKVQALPSSADPYHVSITDEPE